MSVPPENGTSLSGAESLLHTLVACGVDTCFANPGTSEMHFVAALDAVPAMRPVLCLFEGVATGAADGYARMAGKPASTLLHLGPGLANGLAGLHNARRAQSSIVNIVGDHATYHLQYDAPLTSDIAGFARPVSDWVRRPASARALPGDVATAVACARRSPGQIATLILPADTAWAPAERIGLPETEMLPATTPESTLEHVAGLLRGPSRSAMLLRGDVLHGQGLQWAARIAARTGTKLFCDTFAPRIRRGRHHPVIERLHYRGDEVLRQLAAFDQLVLVGAEPPVAFFAYPGRPSWLVPPDCALHTLTLPREDGPDALERLADRLEAKTYCPPARLTVAAPQSDESLTPDSILRCVTIDLPEDAIVIDEGLTSTFPNYDLLDAALPHDHLNLTGGAIGSGIPLSVGAAVAAPTRKVVCLHGDGGAMYNLQGLWTQARERLDVITIIFANRAYAILEQELDRVGARVDGTRSRRLLDIGDPDLDWTALATGMGVAAERVTTVAAFRETFGRAIRATGPILIEAVIA
ncbi:acetolactate synthase large subunit [Gluconacetobacter diazotrophicus]|uniref:Thiamine pyrophosphate enzyme-like TPP-binding n=1 Tax=Gluconacetobacter diazotrophicus (strain ATCC 49037 / DSM 5601 / CCUG 37298 / CIP 103539 / LMG 7603 / PAl5) TaxID=272568 RepID=A9HQ39_GLUDA|nr:acetolactate synthase large subunit [Gluconacetobacter diazotrophicus]CAP56674.1 thiamine pyrophosphate enzyme-like TPP-binding [Gluconacetobacter diazotrophicus PA1 5]